MLFLEEDKISQNVKFYYAKLTFCLFFIIKVQKLHKFLIGSLFENDISNKHFKTLKIIIMTQLVKTNNPFAKSFDGLLNDLFTDFGGPFGKVIREDILVVPPVNITEHANSYQIELSAPGYDKSAFNVKLDGTILTISAEKKEEKTEETPGKTIRKEFSQKSFKRSFTVDEKINANGINAKYENGILQIQLPKKEEAQVQPKEIAIQ